MPDVSGPFDTASFLQAQWFRDRGYLDPSGVYGTPAATAAAGDLGLTLNGLTSSLTLGRAHVRGAYYERTGTTSDYTHPANTAGTVRIDRVVLRRSLTAKTVVPAVVQGTAGAGLPALTQVEDGVWEQPLHAVTVPINSGTVLTVADERSWIDPATGETVAWTPILFTNSQWAQWNANGFNELCRVHESGAGFREVTGLFANTGALAAGSYVIGNIPAGWRPPTNLLRVGRLNSTTLVAVDVLSSTGNIVANNLPSVGAGSTFQLDALRWRK